jgi:uncharacterized membrane protein YjdF
VHPVDRDVWMLENVLTLVGMVMMTASYWRFPLSRVSYTCIFVFGVLHAFGAHYTYSLVPYDDWARAAFGASIDRLLGFERNQYDRAIHFLWGLLLAYPAREVFVRIARVRGFWGYALPLILIMASSVLYEMIEWFAAVVFGGDPARTWARKGRGTGTRTWRFASPARSPDDRGCSLMPCCSAFPRGVAEEPVGLGYRAARRWRSWPGAHGTIQRTRSWRLQLRWPMSSRSEALTDSVRSRDA